MARSKISKAVRFDVFTRDGFKCRYCGRTQHDGATLHLDHVIPASMGGKNSADNLVTACQDCNLGKSDRPVGVPVANAQSQTKTTWGLSFNEQGKCIWQFAIKDTTDAAAKLITFSWMTGEPYSEETVSRSFLNDNCMLFVSEDDFLEAAEYWGGFRNDRVNLRFSKKVEA